MCGVVCVWCVVWCVWCVVVWCGAVWCGVVWCGVCGVVWCDVVWCGVLVPAQVLCVEAQVATADSVSGCNDTIVLPTLQVLPLCERQGRGQRQEEQGADDTLVWRACSSVLAFGVWVAERFA